MGLDVVELVLRCEEDFEIALEDHRLEQMCTVGDLFELICAELHLPTAPEAPRPAQRVYLPAATAHQQGWTRDTVWSRLVQIVLDQLQVSPEDVTYAARFSEDLRAD